MDTHFNNLADGFKSIVNFDVVGRFFFLGAIAVSVAIGLGLYHWIEEPIYTPLPYYVNENNLSSLVQELDKANIRYRVSEYNHSISVPINDVSKAKLNLSMAGVTKDDSFSFSYLNDQSQLGNSQFLESARYVHSLEADLARTISALQGINAAKVHLAIPQRNIFSDENNKPTASVVVNFNPGYENDKDKVKSITQLVAASVPGLEPSSVVITNQYGHYLSSIVNQDALLNQEQLDYQNNLQMYYEKKIRSLISPMVGVDKTSISVNIDLDFTQQEEAKEAFDPTQATLRSEQNVSENNSSGSAQGVPGSLSNQPPSSQPAAGGGSSTQGAQSRTESIKNYEITKSVHYVKTTAPKIKNISVAVIIDDEMVYDKKAKKMLPHPVATEKLDKLTELIKSTIGFNQNRNDRVTVVNSVFLPEQIEQQEKIPLWEQPLILEWSKKILGILLGFIGLFTIYKKFIGNFKPKSHNTLPLVTNGAIQEPQITPEMMQLKEEQIKILKELVAKDPNKVANIIKKWIAN